MEKKTIVIWLTICILIIIVIGFVKSNTEIIQTYEKITTKVGSYLQVKSSDGKVKGMIFKVDEFAKPQINERGEEFYNMNDVVSVLNEEKKTEIKEITN